MLKIFKSSPLPMQKKTHFHRYFCSLNIDGQNSWLTGCGGLRSYDCACLYEPRLANLCLPAFRHYTAHAQPFRGARNLAFCLKVPFDSLLVWASSEGSGETARMRRLAWTFAARIGDMYQIRLTRSICRKRSCYSEHLRFISNSGDSVLYLVHL